MRPSSRLLVILGILIALSAALAIARGFMPVEISAVMTTAWKGLFLSIIIIACIDTLFWNKDLKKIHGKRITPGSLALGVDNNVNLIIENLSLRPVHVVITDQYPAEVEATNIPRPLVIGANNKANIQYNVRPLKRGDANFGFISLRILSKLKLWQFHFALGNKETVKIYPNFRSISHFKKLGLNHHIKQIGIHTKQRRGQGIDFHQLREFREGDSLNQIDWKATARIRKPISREYQDEKDQDIIFLLDCGRRMHSKDGELSHFDHVLNAFLLTSHVALRQGDAVGLMTFSGSNRWVNPIKGQHSINTLLNQIYDLHSSTDTSDFVQAAQQLINKHRKHALIIIITNLHEEDSDDLKSAIQLITKQHLVIIANLRELFLDENLRPQVHSLESALNYAGTIEFISKRHRLLDTLKKQGVIIVDSTPHLLHINLINEYLALKRRGVI